MVYLRTATPTYLESMSGTEADLPLINCCVNQDATFRSTGEGVNAFQAPRRSQLNRAHCRIPKDLVTPRGLPEGPRRHLS
jgi:hypothetical protein